MNVGEKLCPSRASLSLPNTITSLAPLSCFQKPLSHTSHPHLAHTSSRHKNKEIFQTSTSVMGKRRTALSQASRASTLGTKCEQCPRGGAETTAKTLWPEATPAFPEGGSSAKWKNANICVIGYTASIDTVRISRYACTLSWQTC